MAVNYDDVLDQLRAAGLIVESLAVGKLTRCKIEDDGEKRGWYSLHEITLSGGDQVLVGSYGVWYGNENNSQKIALRKLQLTAEQKEALRARQKEDQKRAEGLRKAQAEAAAGKAERKWAELVASGDHDYLTRKGIAAHGVRFAPDGTRIDYDYDGKVIEAPIGGALGIPLCDTAGRIWGLQFILSRAHSANRIERLGRDKEYWPQGMDKVGKFHWVGGVPDTVLFVAEGYATGASFHAATGLPVAIAFDANNLGPVATALHKKYKRVRIGFLADDDAFAKCPATACQTRLVVAESPNCPSCGQPHNRKNTGVTAAETAALAVDGFVLAPRFGDEAARRDAWLQHSKKLTDWNDLHEREGLAVVRAQAEEALAAKGITPVPARRALAQPKGEGGNGGGAPVQIRPVSSLTELLQRFVIIYGEGDVAFDRELNKLVKFKDVQNLTLSREVYARWTESPDKQFAMLTNVGFDPAGKDPMVTCNVYAGWPTVPKEGSCEMLLELLWYLCSAESNAQEVYAWLLKWLAYPIQHPGAKMQSAVVVHGKQGTGKSLIFKAVCAIYGNYGLTINQSAVENPRNTWLASRLFVLAEEVIARKELHHVKNALKDLITGDTVYVDPKFVNPYPERNHVNLAFVSNETQPVILEDDDRRHLVIWTPDKQPDSFYHQVRAEMDNGGVAALHHHLATLDLGDFGPHTKPPMTASKRDLINLSLDSTDRFWRALVEGQLENIRTQTIALASDLYKLYQHWCSQIGVHAAPMPKLLNTLEKKHGMRTARKRWNDNATVKGPHSVCLIPTLQADVGGKPQFINPEKPADLTEPMWIGNHVSAFRAAVRDYKGAGYAA